jgi:hypothetical protein
MSSLGLETGFPIGEILELFLTIKWFMFLDQIESSDNIMNPSRINLTYHHNFNIDLGPVLDYLRVSRLADRQHFLGYREGPFDN